MARIKHNQWVAFIRLLSGAVVLAEHQRDGQRALTDGLMTRTRQESSVCIETASWADFSPSQNNSLCKATHLWWGKPHDLGLCLQQPQQLGSDILEQKADLYMKSPAKHEWWAEGSLAKLWGSLWNSFPEVRGNQFLTSSRRQNHPQKWSGKQIPNSFETQTI